MFKITKRFEFEATHKLKLTYDSPCANFHGHSYKVEINIQSEELDENGMVMDFSKLNLLKDWVMENWDHAAIVPTSLVTDEIKAEFGKLYEFPHANTTAEYMCFYLHQKAIELFDADGKDISITVYETTNNCATYTM